MKNCFSDIVVWVFSNPIVFILLHLYKGCLFVMGVNQNHNIFFSHEPDRFLHKIELTLCVANSQMDEIHCVLESKCQCLHVYRPRLRFGWWWWSFAIPVQIHTPSQRDALFNIHTGSAVFHVKLTEVRGVKISNGIASNKTH